MYNVILIIAAIFNFVIAFFDVQYDKDTFSYLWLISGIFFSLAVIVRLITKGIKDERN